MAGNSLAQEITTITIEQYEWIAVEAYLQRTIKSGNTEQKRDALFRIRNLKTAEASRLAVAALSDNSEIVRASAAQSIVFLPPNEAAPLLVPLLRDKSVLVRKEAAYALGKTRNPQAVLSLVEIIQRDKIQEVKDAATVALGEIGDVSALDALTRILQRRLKDEEEFFRRAAARSIGQIAQIIQTNETEIVTPENFLPRELKNTTKPVYKNLSETFPQFRAALPVLTQSLQNPREFADVKREAAFALGTIGDESSIPVLQANVKSEDYYLAEISREALEKLSK
ncbi:MAG TPA: HEAT repeat domain-containing protein [Pyrinomonadaceae bacterium]